MEHPSHDVEFWYPSQPSRRSAIGTIVLMLGIVLAASAAIVGAVV